jgi:hypothetical protein
VETEGGVGGVPVEELFGIENGFLFKCTPE